MKFKTNEGKHHEDKMITSKFRKTLLLNKISMVWKQKRCIYSRAYWFGIINYHSGNMKGCLRNDIILCMNICGNKKIGMNIAKTRHILFYRKMCTNIYWKKYAFLFIIHYIVVLTLWKEMTRSFPTFLMRMSGTQCFVSVCGVDESIFIYSK